MFYKARYLSQKQGTCNIGVLGYNIIISKQERKKKRILQDEVLSQDNFCKKFLTFFV
jgi:hypothetical protein